MGLKNEHLEMLRFETTFFNQERFFDTPIYIHIDMIRGLKTLSDKQLETLDKNLNKHGRFLFGAFFQNGTTIDLNREKILTGWHCVGIISSGFFIDKYDLEHATYEDKQWIMYNPEGVGSIEESRFLYAAIIAIRNAVEANIIMN